MKKKYFKPGVTVVKLDSEMPLLAGSNKLDNEENGEAGANAMDLDYEEWDE